MKSIESTPPERKLQNVRSNGNLYVGESSHSSRFFGLGSESDEKMKASAYLKGDAGRTYEAIRREN